MAHQETLIAWLNDAYAMENNLIQTLENHAKDAKDHPQMRAKIEEHLQATRRHADMVKGCVERLGSSTSAIKTGISHLVSAVQGIGTGAASDELVKNTLSDYAAEYFEIACYTSLITAAQSLGETEVARICQQILRDEQDMARWLEQQIPTVTQEFLNIQAREHGAA
jgi:ferritin-like metal-binding protein YciE